MKSLKALLIAAAVAPGLVDEIRKFECGAAGCYWIVSQIMPDGSVDTKWSLETKAHKDWRDCKKEADCPGRKNAPKGFVFKCEDVVVECPKEPKE